MEDYVNFISRIVKICKGYDAKVQLNPLWRKTNQGVYVEVCGSYLSYIWTPLGELVVSGVRLGDKAIQGELQEKLFWGQLVDVSDTVRFWHFNQETGDKYGESGFRTSDDVGNTFRMFRYTGLRNPDPNIPDELYINYSPTREQYRLDKLIEKEIFE